MNTVSEELVASPDLSVWLFSEAATQWRLFVRDWHHDTNSHYHYIMPDGNVGGYCTYPDRESAECAYALFLLRQQGE